MDRAEYIRSETCLRKDDLSVNDKIDFSLLDHPNEKLLMRRMLDFERVVWKSGELFKPSLLARYLYALCRDFSRAYGTCSVKHAGSEALQSAKLDISSQGIITADNLMEKVRELPNNTN